MKEKKKGRGKEEKDERNVKTQMKMKSIHVFPVPGKYIE